jgi:hypothetical protein
MSTETILRLHNIYSKPAFFYGSETWVINKRDAQKLEAAQMRFVRSLLGFTRLDQRNSDIHKKLEVGNIVEDIKLYQKKWNWHLQRMNRNCIPQLAFRYQPDGKRDLGRPQQTWRDQEHLQELKRNRFLRPKPYEFMMMMMVMFQAICPSSDNTICNLIW